jgi:CheY-like chemotaxis protein
MPITPYILIADDDPEDQEMIIELLRERLPDACIKSIPNGTDLMEWLSGCAHNELPSLMLLDYKMPGMTGADVLRATELDGNYKPIPKLIWSTSNNAEYIELCMRRGALQYFVKPNDLAGLGRIADAVQELFLRAHSRQAVHGL